MVCSRWFVTRIAAYIAIVAILMLTAAPPISQHLQGALGQVTTTEAAQHHQPELSNTHHPHHNHTALERAPPNAAPSSASPHHMMMGGMMSDMLACGYCELLIHVPFIIWAFFPKLHHTLTPQRQKITVIRRESYRARYVAFYTARAPPIQPASV